MRIRKPHKRARQLVAVGAAASTLIGIGATAPVANAAGLAFPTYTLSYAAQGTQPAGPRFFEGFSSTINVAGSETAEYALELVGALYNNAGIFGGNQNSDKRTINTSTPVLPSTDIYDNFDHNVVSNAQAVGSAAGVQELCQTPTGQLPALPGGSFSATPGTASSGSSTTLTDSGASWTANQWDQFHVTTSATGTTDYLITSNTATTLTISGTFSTAPSSGTTYNITNEVWPYYTYPTPGSTFEADGIPIDLVRASASEFDLSNHGVAVCAGLQQQGVASDAVVGLSFSPNATDPDGSAIEDVAPASIDFASTGGTEQYTDTAWRVFCAPATDPLSITTWDQLYQAEGIANPPTPDQPLVLWGPKNNSGTGATWYTFAGCGTGTGRILSDHLITENDAQQLSQYAAQNTNGSVAENVLGCPANTTVSGEACGPNGVSAAAAASAPTDNCGGTGVGSGLGTATYTVANEQCIDQEVADSLFFMSYGYFISHPFTAGVSIPTAAVGALPSYIQASNYQVAGNPSTIAGASVSGSVLGQPGTGGVAGDPRATNSAAVQTGRDLWLDYLTANVRASAAGFVNWVCDEGDQITHKGVDLTTGTPIDTEITQAITSWGFGRLSCDGGTGAYGVRGSTYTSAITSAVVDPGPPNNE